MYSHKLRTGQSKARAGSASSGVTQEESLRGLQAHYLVPKGEECN